MQGKQWGGQENPGEPKIEPLFGTGRRQQHAGNWREQDKHGHIYHLVFGEFRFGLGGLHGMIWVLLLLSILLHVGAALYHQFFIKDNLFKRMWFGKQE